MEAEARPGTAEAGPGTAEAGPGAVVERDLKKSQLAPYLLSLNLCGRGPFQEGVGPSWKSPGHGWEGLAADVAGFLIPLERGIQFSEKEEGTNGFNLLKWTIISVLSPSV